MKKSLLLLALGAHTFLSAQLIIDTLAIQDFEVTPMSPVWTFTGPVVYNSGFSAANAAPPNSPIGIGGSRAWETTTNSTGLILEFGNVTVNPGYDSVRVQFRLAAMNLGGSTGGPDNLDYVLTEVSLDGGSTYYQRLRIRGAVANNSYWPYSATGVAKVYYTPQTEVVFAPTSSGLQTTEGYSFCEITFPGSVTQVRIRMTGRSSSASDTWLVDNVMITGEYQNPSSAGETVMNNDWMIYPNPSDGIFTIENRNSSSAPDEITVSDLSGKELFTVIPHAPGQKILLDLAAWPAGMYIVRIRSAERTFIKKLIRN